MTYGISSDFNSTVRQLQGLFNQFGGTTFKGGSYVNSIFNVAGSVGMIAQGNDAQKAQGIQNLVNEAMSLIQKLVNPEGEASRKVADNKKGSQEVEKSAEEIKAELNTSIEEIGGQIETQVGIVEEANTAISETQQELQEKEENIKSLVENIKAAQKELESATTLEEKLALLDEIGCHNSEILALLSNIGDLQSVVTEEATKVETAFAEIETAKGNAVERQENGELKITATMQEAAQNTTETTATAADGVKNESLGAALEAAGATEAAIPVVGPALSSTTIQKGTELIAAGGIEISGSVANLQSLLQGIGKVVGNTELLTTFKNAIGGALGNFNNAIGGWNTIIEPTLTSLGSLAGEGGYAAQSAQLAGLITEDFNTLGVSEKVEDGKFTMKDGYSIDIFAGSENIAPAFGNIATKIDGIFGSQEKTNKESFNFVSESKKEINKTQSSVLAQNPQENTLKTPKFQFGL